MSIEPSSDKGQRRPRRWGWFVLAASSTTLLCCALPILLVTAGFGAVSAALFSNLPFLVTLAQHKAWMFGGSAAFLILTAWWLFRPGRHCPTDPELARLCEQAQWWNVRLFAFSVVIWCIGFAAAYLALPLYLWIEGA